MNNELIGLVKQNLIIEHDGDDGLIASFVEAATSYATGYQHLDDGFYDTEPMSEATRQGVVMLATHFFESRDGSIAGFWADKPEAARAVWGAVNTLLRLDRDWKI
ncbi:head-tail connector protein [Propionimicrobium lymphophilum]|uniref:head-tail connector protein n=1 Tax=Propionimicrobium lymphophilum TaxID=33012 RepID=UPI0023F50176|nr:head-tail connector protein [Propionimicrobium lymphophilum]